jgi:CubicO group peptidase (beta-lactamase class C family)
MEGDTRLRSKLWPVSVTAAGGMSTSIASFANWLRFHLGKGEFEGQRLLSPGLIQELQKPRVHVGAPEFAEYSDVHYGLGFRSHRYRGARVVWHGGGFTGTNMLMMMLPDRGVGVAVLANNGMNPLFAPHILANYVFDRVCGKGPAPWLDRFRERPPQIRSAARR